MKVYLIGVGMGNPATLTGQALEAIGDSPVLVGAPRLLEPWTEGHDCVPLIAAADIAAYVDKAPRGPVGVLLSGDTGFYSGAKGLWPLLGNHEVITIPGISSLSYFCARLQTTWQDARLVSAHGRSHNAVGNAAQRQGLCPHRRGHQGGGHLPGPGRAGAGTGAGLRGRAAELRRRAHRHRHGGGAGGGDLCRPLRPAGGQPRSGGAAVERLRPARRGLSPGGRAHDQGGGARAGPVQAAAGGAPCGVGRGGGHRLGVGGVRPLLSRRPGVRRGEEGGGPGPAGGEQGPLPRRQPGGGGGHRAGGAGGPLRPRPGLPGGHLGQSGGHFERDLPQEPRRPGGVHRRHPGDGGGGRPVLCRAGGGGHGAGGRHPHPARRALPPDGRPEPGFDLSGEGRA